VSKRFTPRCTAAHATAENIREVMDLVQQDFASVARVLNQRQVIHLSAPDRLLIPEFGKAEVYIATNVSTASSSGVDLHTITLKRSGQAEGTQSIVTSAAEMVAYKLYFLGTVAVGPGDILSYTLTVTGAPSPTLTSANLTMLAILTPTEVPV
jgi:hypothetical protein